MLRNHTNVYACFLQYVQHDKGLPRSDGRVLYLPLFRNVKEVCLASEPHQIKVVIKIMNMAKTQMSSVNTA